jgi:surface carbohydrate biosynthesis protein
MWRDKLKSFSIKAGSNNAYKLVLLPVELKNREFHANILLASRLVLKGYRVIIGSHAAIFSFLRAMGVENYGGAYLDKSTQIFELSSFISSRVDAMLILDQELSPIQNELGIYRLRNVVEERFYENTKPFIDGFFTVGPGITSSALQVLEPKKVIETGWPRFELLEHYATAVYDSEIKKIHQEFGDFCLFVSSFSLVQSLTRTRTLAPISKLGWVTEHFNEQWWIKQFSQLDRFVETLVEWRRIGFSQTIVIRPHLYEDLKSWKELVRDIPGIHVVKRGEINPWVHAASSVLHRGSTVSLQSALIGKPTFSLPECTPDEFALTLEFSQPLSMSKPPPMTFDKFLGGNDPYEFSRLVTNLGLGSPSEEISRFIESLDLGRTRGVSRVKIFWTYFSSFRSWRRGLGLLKDEIRRYLGFNVGTTVSIALPWGLSSFEVRRVLTGIHNAISPEIDVKQLAINLIELKPVYELNKEEKTK